jgi:hypothetical protein
MPAASRNSQASKQIIKQLKETDAYEKVVCFPGNNQFICLP